MIVEGTVEVAGTVKVDQSGNIKNYLVMAANSLAGSNGQETYEYANKVLEISPENSEAWLLKMKSIQWIATLGDPRVA